MSQGDLKKLLWTIAIFVGLFEVYSVRPHGWEEPEPTDAGIKHFLQGAIHVHTKASDGGSSVAEIASEAKKAGLDFVVITDTNSSAARPEEGTIDDVDMFVEMETVTPAGILIPFYSHTNVVNEPDAKVAQLAWQQFQGKTQVPGLFNVVAHPSHPDKPWNELARVPEGIEVFNFDSLWKKHVDSSLLKAGITLFIYPLSNFLSGLRMVQANRKDLTTWDAMNAISPGRFGILSANSHANLKIAPGFSLAWPRHEQLFKMGSNVLFYDPPLSLDFPTRKKQIYELIRQGRGAMSFDFLHPFRGNDWTLECPEAVYRSGDRVPFKTGCEFVVNLPKDLNYHTTLRLWRSGELVKEVTDPAALTRLPVDAAGAYRLEVWLRVSTLFTVLLSGDVPYVFYNPIYVQ